MPNENKLTQLINIQKEGEALFDGIKIEGSIQMGLLEDCENCVTPDSNLFICRN